MNAVTKDSTNSRTPASRAVILHERGAKARVARELSKLLLSEYSNVELIEFSAKDEASLDTGDCSLLVIILSITARSFLNLYGPLVLETPLFVISAEKNLSADLSSDLPYPSFVIPLNSCRARYLSESLASFKSRINQIQETTFNLGFEKLANRLTSRFINLDLKDIDETVEQALAELARFGKADRAYLFELEKNDHSYAMKYEWHSPGIKPARDYYQSLTPTMDLKIFKHLRKGNTLRIRHLDQITPGNPLYNLLEGHQVKSLVTVPMIARGELIGFLGFSSIFEEREWSEDTIELLKQVAEAITNLLRRRSMEEALNRNKTRYKALVESLGEGVVLADPSDTILWTNQRLLELTGYTRDEVIGRHASSVFVRSLSAQEELKAQTELRLKGEAATYEITLDRKDGSQFLAEVSATPLRDEEDNITGTIGIVSDIEARKESEKSLLEHKEFLQGIVDTSPNYVFTRNLEGRYTFVNTAMARLYGLGVEEMIGLHAVDIAHNQDETQRYIEQDKTVITSGIPYISTSEKFTDPASGETRWLQVVKRPLKVPGETEPQALAILTDVTEIKKAELTLQQLSEQTAALTGEPFYAKLVQDLADLFNAHSVVIGKLQDEETLALETLASWSEGTSGVPRNWSIKSGPLRNIFDADLRKGEDLQDTSLEALANGSSRSYIATPIRSSSGEKLGIILILNDQPLISAPFSHSLLSVFAGRVAGELQRELREQERFNLERQLMQSQKMEAIGQMAAGVAHDLNNSLGAVGGHLQLMRQAPHLPSDLKQSVEIALKGCEQSSEFIERLLKFARHDKSGFKSVHVGQAVTETIEFLSQVLGRDFRIVISGDTQGISIKADQSQFQQVLINLIMNAKHAMDGVGTVQLSINPAYIPDPTPWNTNAAPGEFVQISVTDSGIGIETEDLDKIFQPFFTSKAEGSGLGLAMAYGIMQAHGGWIEASSTPGKGSTFTINFPRAEAKLSEQVEIVSETTDEKNIILVIDDEETLVDLALRFLTQYGYQARGFSDPQQAIKWFKQNSSKVALVILDIRMPGMRGTDVFRLLKQQDPQIKIALLSGEVQSEDAQTMMQLGARAFFKKPLRYPELMSWIEENIRLEPNSNSSDYSASESSGNLIELPRTLDK